MPYLLDANVFIQAKRLHYGMDFCPAFWDRLITRNAANDVFSIERVGDELLAGGDELSDWATDRGADFFLKPDNRLLPALSAVSAWAAGQTYEPAAVNTFLQVADYYLVARYKVRHSLRNAADSTGAFHSWPDAIDTCHARRGR